MKNICGIWIVLFALPISSQGQWKEFDSLFVEIELTDSIVIEAPSLNYNYNYSSRTMMFEKCGQFLPDSINAYNPVWKLRQGNHVFYFVASLAT